MHKVRSMQKWFVERALTSTPPNSFGMNWNVDCEPGPTSVPDHSNALVAECKKITSAMFQHLVESLPRRVEAVIAAKGGPTPHKWP